MEEDEDTITFTMAEFGQFQSEKLALKHENDRLKTIADKYEELLKHSSHPLAEINELRSSVQEKTKTCEELEEKLRNIPEFKREIILQSLTSVRREDMIEEEKHLLEQVLDIVQNIWPHWAKGEIHKPEEKFIKNLADHNEIQKLGKNNKKLIEGMDLANERCKLLENSLLNATKLNESLESQVKELQSQKERLIFELAEKEEEVNEARVALKEKYAVECSRKDLESEIENYRQKVSVLENEIKEEKKKHGENLEEKIKTLQNENEELQKALAESKGNENLLTIEHRNLKSSAKETLQELNTVYTRNRELESQIKKAEETLKKAYSDLEDAKTEKQIIQKRSMHDLKDLKSELAREKTALEQCKMEKEKLTNEFRSLQDSQKVTTKIIPQTPTHQEKKLVEALAQRVGELEMENKAYRDRILEIDGVFLELENSEKENEELRNEINRLQIDIATLGASFNEMIRKGNFK
ncbi:unnamed protein product [Blepharisma stoltei]|uniref:Uncharacterized protein n=1 Tax=Blepharisma stoltei TaxID=1481888 RepID=A0AAU9ITD4_9CILI|nr:unnamed protein product [Blepharisma stoltei]